MRVAAILHPYDSEKLLEPFRAAGVNLFRGNQVERNDLPDAVIVFGGDGSVHRLLASLAGTECPLLVVPTGSGNDFARAIGLQTPTDSLVAWKKFLADRNAVRTIDLGLIEPLEELLDESADGEQRRTTWTFADREGRFPKPESKLGSSIMKTQLHHLTDEEDAARKRYFCCIAGVGLDAEANEIANRMSRWLRQHGGYSLAALKALMRHRANVVSVTAVEGSENSVAGPALLCAFGNANSYGGGMRMLPKAKLDDGKLDVCFVGEVAKTTVMRWFHTIYSGNHLGLAPVRYFQTTEILVRTEKPMPIYADGELAGQTPARVSIVPGGLRVIVK